MAVTDSAPTFLARCASLGITQTVQDSLVASGLDTISKFAFCSSYVPGQTNERPFVEAITNALMRDPTVGELAALRRLLHESYSMTAAEVKQSVERQEDQSIKRLAQPERADHWQNSRLAFQAFRFVGMLSRVIDWWILQYLCMRRIVFLTLSLLQLLRKNKRSFQNPKKTNIFLL